MTNIILKAEKRVATGHKVSELRKQKQTPCVIYGHGIKTESLAVASAALADVVAKAGSSTVIELEVGPDKRDAIIHALQRDPVSGKILHCDFYQIKKGEKIKAEVNLKYSGVSAAVKDFGGILVKSVDKLEIEALPKDLPHEITVDISMMAKIDDSISLDQLEIPAGVLVLNMEKAQVITSVMPPRTEEELKKLDEEVTEDVEKVEGVKTEEEGAEVAEGEEGEAAKSEGGTAKDGEDAGAGKVADQTESSAKEDKK